MTLTGLNSCITLIGGADWATSFPPGPSTIFAAVHAESSKPGRSQPAISLRAS